MTVWIRSVLDWSHLAKLPAVSWDLPLWSDSPKDSGSVTVVGEIKDRTGDWAVLDGRPYLIKSCSPSKGQTRMELLLPENVFARQLRYSGGGTEQYGTYIAATISSEYVSQSDSMYALPYLTVSSSDTTPFVFPVDTGELYTLLDIITDAMTEEVYLTWAATATGITIAIDDRAAADHNLFFDDGHTQLSAQTYTAKVIAKAGVRLLQEVEDGVITVVDSGTYYWHSDGTVSATAPSPRIAGEWIQVDAGYDAESGESTETQLLKAATEAMAGNTLAYKLEFWSDRVYQLGDILTCRIGEIVTRAVLTYARRSSRDNRIFYRAGRAVLTLTDILRQQDEEEKKTGAKLSGKSSSGHTHDNRYYTEAEVKELLNGLLVTDNYTVSITNLASGDATGDQETSATKSGYTCLGVVGISSNGTNNTLMNIVRCYYSGNDGKIHTNVRNLHSASISCTINVTLLWRKNM